MPEQDQTLSLTYLEFVTEIQRWLAGKRTGTMLIATEDNHLAKILFDGGAITFLSYGPKSGREVIPFFKQIRHARVKTSQGKPAQPADASLPPTAEIIKQLASIGEAGESVVPSGVPLEGAQLENALKIIEAELTEHLGPLGDIVWTEHLERIGKPLTALRLRELVEGLSREIGDPAKIQRFKDAIREKIGGA